MIWRMSGPRQGSGVRPALCQPMAQSGHGSIPTRLAMADALSRSWFGYGSSTRIRSGSECAVNSTLCRGGTAARASVRAVVRKSR